MHQLTTSPAPPTTRHAVANARPSSPTPRSTAAADDSIGGLATGDGFAAMLVAFRATGGTARADDVARLLADHGLGDYVGLARLIAARDVFGFDWRGTLWIPMFQFDLRDLSVNPSARRVLAELGSGFSGWEGAAWLARANAWLGDRAPVDMLGAHLSDVLAAARTGRFVAAG